jgi:hypothetical protein
MFIPPAPRLMASAIAAELLAPLMSRFGASDGSAPWHNALEQVSPLTGFVVHQLAVGTVPCRERRPCPRQGTKTNDCMPQE